MGHVPTHPFPDVIPNPDLTLTQTLNLTQETVGTWPATEQSPVKMPFIPCLFTSYVSHSVSVIVLAMEFDVARYVMLQAHNNGMVDGTYAYIFLDLDEWDSESRRKFPRHWLQVIVRPLREKECELRKAFESMLVLRSKPPSIPPEIIEKINEFSDQWPFNTGNTTYDNDRVRWCAHIAFHQCEETFAIRNLCVIIS